MHKRTWMLLVILLVVAAWSVNAYADTMTGEVTPWQGFWNSVGGFLYNALPWNWHNWMGQS